MIYCKCKYENVHIRLPQRRKNKILRLRIVKVILNVVLWKYISDRNCDYFILLFSGRLTTTLYIPLSRTTKPSTYVNDGFEETRTQNHLIIGGENTRSGRTGLSV